MRSALAIALEALHPADRILVFTGAGISTESGIPDFRGRDGLWKRVDPEEFTIQRYRTVRETRVRGWQMHQRGELWGSRSRVQPNAAHRAIVRLWQAERMSGCVTQNVDGLHQAAGLPDRAVAELHGNIRKAHCLGCGTRWDTEEVLAWVDAGEEDPHCPDCGELVKTTTVMFGEYLPEEDLRRAGRFALAADAVLVVGSTLSVFPAADIPLTAARRGVPMVIVNLGPTEHDGDAVARIDGKAGEVLPRLIDELVA